MNIPIKVKTKFKLGDKVTQISMPGTKGIISEIDADPSKSFSGNVYYAVTWYAGMKQQYQASNKWWSAAYLKKI